MTNIHTNTIEDIYTQNKAPQNKVAQNKAKFDSQKAQNKAPVEKIKETKQVYILKRGETETGYQQKHIMDPQLVDVREDSSESSESDDEREDLCVSTGNEKLASEEAEVSNKQSQDGKITKLISKSQDHIDRRKSTENKSWNQICSDKLNFSDNDSHSQDTICTIQELRNFAASLASNIVPHTVNGQEDLDGFQIVKGRKRRQYIPNPEHQRQTRANNKTFTTRITTNNDD